jgi:hypothetical protein
LVTNYYLLKFTAKSWGTDKIPFVLPHAGTVEFIRHLATESKSLTKKGVLNMLKNIGLTLVVLTIFCACTEKNVTDPLNPETMYFPLQAGNVWQYATNLENPEPGLELRILSSIKIGNFDYFLWGNNTWIDTLRHDAKGNIWQYTAGQDFLRFAFSLDDRATYFFPDAKAGETQAHPVEVWKNQTVETPAGTFKNCIRFFLQGQAIDGLTYAFAPGVGPVAIESWAGYRLLSAEVYGKKVGGR